MLLFLSLEATALEREIHLLREHYEDTRMKQAEPKAKPMAKSVRSAIVAVVVQPFGHLIAPL